MDLALDSNILYNSTAITTTTTTTTTVLRSFDIPLSLNTLISIQFILIAGLLYRYIKCFITFNSGY